MSSKSLVTSISRLFLVPAKRRLHWVPIHQGLYSPFKRVTEHTRDWFAGVRTSLGLRGRWVLTRESYVFGEFILQMFSLFPLFLSLSGSQRTPSGQSSTLMSQLQPLATYIDSSRGCSSSWAKLNLFDHHGHHIPIPLLELT